jgi:hypothetical protein
VINEVLSNTQLPYVDAIELRSNTASGLDIGRWYLSNVRDPEDADSYKQYAISNGTGVPPLGYLVFDETNFNPNGNWNPTPGTPAPGDFSLDGYHDGEVWLIEADAAGQTVEICRPSRVWAGTAERSVGPLAKRVGLALSDETAHAGRRELRLNPKGKARRPEQRTASGSARPA